MGLTIHYTLDAARKTGANVTQQVYQMRQMALDLPFESVGEIVDIRGSDCDFEARRAELQGGNEQQESLFWLLIQAGQSVRCPWNQHLSRRLRPTRIIAFDTWPGPGCEAANFGLCCYPAEIDWEYQPLDDQRFAEGEYGDFSRRKWDRYCQRHYGDRRSPARSESRQVPTKLASWHWSSFCKTQYASDPACGGVPNFLKCHISVITLLDRIAKLPGLKVTVDDEGRYGPATYSTDWKAAQAAGRRPAYRRHTGRYSPAALVQEVGEWNALLAGFSGALSDALAGSGRQLEAPIKHFPNFEQLEFKGRNLKYLDPFLTAVKAIAMAGEEGRPVISGKES